MLYWYLIGVAAWLCFVVGIWALVRVGALRDAQELAIGVAAFDKSHGNPGLGQYDCPDAAPPSLTANSVRPQHCHAEMISPLVAPES